MPTTPPHRPVHGAAPAAGRGRPGTGALGEQLAATHLEAQGLEVVARNWRIADGDLRGELDLVALDHDQRLVAVVEVKTRRGDGFGGPLAAVTPRKQARIRRLAVAFLLRAELPYRRVRLDVVAVRLDHDPPTIQHVPGAF
jgi:putative endonuclease